MDREMWKVPSLKENTFVFFYERLHVLSRHTTGSFHFPLLRWHRLQPVPCWKSLIHPALSVDFGILRNLDLYPGYSS